jgi:hypothetical protein
MKFSLSLSLFFFEAYLYTYRLLRGVVFKVISLSSYAFKPNYAATVGNIFGTPVL